MISVVACTKRADFIEHLIDSYSKQSLSDKELIIILNHSSLDKSKVREQLDDLCIPQQRSIMPTSGITEQLTILQEPETMI
ncbi:glycosyltransferase [Halobacillus yeomjeoni]|uniref:Glycosyltransferase n=1 Tax=Halobacillus yeomjeoni TaxID=311194 RepID=A0A931MU30_9BACI|nr:glycosyltransferase [Halobacillus yeomjeoni]MBH0229035.1 glycosyltransferase [Halobacillus yeomjeoni]